MKKTPRFRYWQEYLRDKFDRQKKRNTVIYTETTGSDRMVVSTATYGDPKDIVWCEPTKYEGPQIIPWNQPIENDNLVWTRTNHKEIFDEFVEQQHQEFELFLEKNRKYGVENIYNGDGNIKEALQGLYFRMRDKLNRYKTLVDSRIEPGDETLEDTLQDLSNYANIAIIVMKNKWK